MVVTLTDVIEPLDEAHFLNHIYGREHAYIKGTEERFASLLPWSALNSILRHHRLEFPRLRLASGGSLVPPSSYSEEIRTRRGRVVPRLLPGPLTEHLRHGATLVLDVIDELHDPISELAIGLERTFRQQVQVSAYASWGSSQGFDLHWDDVDVIVLQVAGRKRWHVYGPSRRWPLFRDIDRNEQPPSQLIAQYMLTSGDVLYIPRGWWHVATALKEPSLHLSFGLFRETGIDLLAWLSDRLVATEQYRQDLPRFANREQRRAHMAQLREAIIESWTVELLDEFFEYQDARATARTYFSLPSAATESILPNNDKARVRLMAPRAFIKSDNGTIELYADKRRWTFAETARPLLETLLEGTSYSVGELCELARAELDPDVVKSLLAELCAQGLIFIIEPSAGDNAPGFQ